MKKRDDQKIVGVIAEQTLVECFRHIAESNGQVDIYQIRFDCFRKGELTPKNIELLRHAPNSGTTMASMRHKDGVLPERQEFEGFKYQDHPLDQVPENTNGDPDLNRIYWLRKAAQEFRMQYFEIEHERRKGFILLGGQSAPKSVVRYTNLKLTPSLEELSRIYSEIVDKGADHVVIETNVREQGKDKGRADKSSLFALAEKSLTGPKPLTIIGLGKYGSRVNIEAYKEGISQFAIGVFPSYNFIPWVNEKRAYHNMPTLEEVTKELGRN